MDGWTDGRTDGRMDKPSYRDARTHLKIRNVFYFFLAGLFGHELVGLFVDAFLNASWIFEYIQSIEPQKE